MRALPLIFMLFACWVSLSRSRVKGFRRKERQEREKRILERQRREGEQTRKQEQKQEQQQEEKQEQRQEPKQENMAGNGVQTQATSDKVEKSSGMLGLGIATPRKGSDSDTNAPAPAVDIRQTELNQFVLYGNLSDW